jgi:hypothetical protein
MTVNASYVNEFSDYKATQTLDSHVTSYETQGIVDLYNCIEQVTFSQEWHMIIFNAKRLWCTSSEETIIFWDWTS